MRHPISNAALDEGDIAIIGQKGKGKSFAGRGLAERLIARGRRVIVLDPMSSWWGLRVSRDGAHAGSPVVVVGGDHADIAITPDMGRLVGKFLLGSKVSAVIDLGAMRKPALYEFSAQLLEELYHGNREPLWIVLEEADVWAPQGARGEEQKAVLAEVEMLARRGRARGFRLISISQRPAKLHKDVLTQFRTMIAFALPGLHDRRAVRDWMEGQTADVEAIYNSLPTLEVGEAWIWTPDRNELRRERFPDIKTLDTSATPKARQARMRGSAFSRRELEDLQQAFDALVPGRAIVRRGPREKRATASVAGDAIARLRTAARLTQSELGSLIGTDQANIARLETGRSLATSRTLERIAEATGHQLAIDFRPGLGAKE